MQVTKVPAAATGRSALPGLSGGRDSGCVSEHDERHEHGRDEAAAQEVPSAHPHLHPHYGPDVCERCGANEKVHKGLCHRCREILRGEGRVLKAEHAEQPHQAQAEPLHSPPWRRRGA